MKAVAALACALLGAGAGEVLAPSAWAEEAERWHGPFGGTFNAQFTIASDYAQNGISNTQLQPAFQMGLDYKTPNLIDAFPLWIYLSGFGSNVQFAGFGPTAEIDAIGGVKAHFLDRKLGVDIGYIRYNYTDIPAELGYNYGEFNFGVNYDFDVVQLGGRLRFSPNSFGNSGNSWNKRALVSAPLTFLKTDTFRFKAYGALGNYWVDNFQAFGLPSQDYWYWTVGVVTSAWGLDLTVAYTDTSIEMDGCGNTRQCAARGFVSITKAF